MFVRFELREKMSEFKAERYQATLRHPDTFERESVTVEVGLDGLKILTPDERRTLRVYGLKNITRWELNGAQLTLYTKTNVDVEERQVFLEAPNNTAQLILDTLTSYYFQFIPFHLPFIKINVFRKSEMMQGGGGGGDGGGSFERESGYARYKGSKSKEVRFVLFFGRREWFKGQSADDVQFWIYPEKEGWMFSQGEVIKTWRRRWFVLKSGYLFRFLNNDIDASSKPRGIVDLSTVTDIAEGSSVTGKPHSLKLSTATGYVCYLTDSETDLVEWLSVLDKAHTEIVKRVAGVEDPVPERPSRKSRQNDMVSVVGYESFPASAPPAASMSDLALNYGDIDGVTGYVDAPSRSPNPYATEYSDSNQIPMPSMYPTPVVPVSYLPQSTYNGSILDQAPQQSPLYPSYQTLSAPEHYSQPSLPHPNVWQVFTTPDGRVYYHNRTTGQTQWERPQEHVM